MLESVKEIFTKEIDLKEVMTKEIEVSDVKNILLMEIEIKKLKGLLETEVKLKEFLLKEINIKDLLPSSNKEEKIIATDDVKEEGLVSEETQAEKQTEAKKLLPPYDYGLIESLRNDHKEICFIYDQLMKCAYDKKYMLVAEHLDNFSTRIRKHYQQADVELYSYLKCYIQQNYPKREKAFNELSLAMKIFYSISQSNNIPLSDETYDGFIEEFEALGINLKDRVEREEKVLFKMYEESHTAVDIS